MLRRVRIVAATLAVACAMAACGKREEPPAGAPAPAPKATARLTAPDPVAPPVAAPVPPVAVPPAAAPAPQAAPAPAAPPIGKVDSLEGEVRLTRAGVARAVQAGMALEQGDALKSGPESWALLAMVDGATVTIRPDTEMRLEAYRYVPDGNPGDNTASWSLVKGALRSITGLIGKSNPPGYQVKTPTATIGIRGTDHEPAYYPPPAPGEKADHPPGTYDKVNSGEAVLRSARGTVPVRKGQTAFANVEATTKPQILARPPAFYQRQAEVDRRVAPRREQFHKDYEQERQKQLQVLRVQQQQKLQEAQKQRLEAAQKAQEERKAKGLEGQKQRLDAQKQQQDARKAEQQQKKSDQKADQRKSDQKADQKKSDQKRADEKKARDKPAAVLPPSVAERIKNMQRGDKAAPGSAARREAVPERDAKAGQKGQAQGQSQRAQPQAQSQRAQPQAQKGQQQQPQPQKGQQQQPQAQKGQQQQQQASPFQALPQRLQPQQQEKATPQQQPQRAQPQPQKGQQQQQRDPRKADQPGR